MKALIDHNISLTADQFSDLEGLSAKCCALVLHELNLDEKLSSFEISILITDNNFIQQINLQQRNLDKPTNVLSFPFLPFYEGSIGANDLGLEHENILGEIIISYEKTLEEASEQNKEPNDHFMHLMIHSLLHLLGFDHMEDREAANMEAIEVKILDSIGVKNPYI